MALWSSNLRVPVIVGIQLAKEIVELEKKKRLFEHNINCLARATHRSVLTESLYIIALVISPRSNLPSYRARFLEASDCSARSRRGFHVPRKTEWQDSRLTCQRPVTKAFWTYLDRTRGMINVASDSCTRLHSVARGDVHDARGRTKSQIRCRKLIERSHGRIYLSR